MPGQTLSEPGFLQARRVRLVRWAATL